jgi:hypothetical protein
VLDLVAIVVSIALIDSLNPSTVGPALYLATAKDARGGLAGFTAGVFGVSLVGGLAVALGPGELVLSAFPHPSRQAKHSIELGLGLAALVLAVVLWLRREPVARGIGRREGRIERASLVLGAGIMALELPTAFPYFAVIAAVVGSGVSVPTEIGLLVLFNAVFVSPLVAILVLRQLAGDRAERSLSAVHTVFHRHAGALIAALALVVALVLLTVGALGLATD